MRKILCFLLFAIAFVFAEEAEKNPWQVVFDGNKTYSNFQLNEQLEIPDEFGNLDTTKQDFMMGLAIENIRALYYSQGFFSLSMKMEIQREYDSNNNRKRVYAISLREGERYHFGGTSIIAPDSSKLSIDMDKLRTNNKERIFSQDDIAEDIQFIQQVYRKAGYLHTYVLPGELIDTTQKVIMVEIIVNPGAKVIMGNMISTAQKNIDKTKKEQEAGLSDTAWLSSLWKTPKGEIINGNQFNSFKSKLLSTQLFTQIKLTDSLRADGLSDIHLNVTERVPGEARYGLFYEEMYGFGAIAYAKHKNFFGTFNEFSTSFQIAQNKQEISLGYANPLLFGTSFSFIPTAIRLEDRLSFNHEKTAPPAYPDSVEERYEIINRGDLTFGITDHIRFRGTVDTRFVSKNGSDMYKVKGEIALTFDYTDDYFNPTKGVRVAPTVGAGTNLNADLEQLTMIGNPYTYGEATVNLYHPLFWTFYGALSGSVGKFFEKALEDDARVFYQGGTRSVRGYRFRSIFASYESYSSSTDDDGNEVIDTIINTGLTPMYFRVNEEIRWTLPWKGWRHWQIVQFYDWTRVMDNERDVYKETAKEALGLGLRYHWQFLTFRLDYAFKKNLSDWGPEGFAWGRFAFDLSQTF
ncbi:MAG: BamA/TamA family outer membrane protein [Fibrobacter sp.]|nr:BamA/TamA family outer membrane protein [Fibrobacter sp.]